MEGGVSESTPLTGTSDKPDKITEDTNCEYVPYYQTKTYEHTAKLLMDDSAVTILIVGNPGSGKTVLVEMLHDKFRCKEVKQKYYDSKYMKRLEDVEAWKVHDNTKMIYILDDVFEDLNQYPKMALETIEKLQNVHKKTVNEEGNCLVITMSRRNYEQNLDAVCKAHLQQCEKLEVVNIQLDITDRTGILDYHRKNGASTAERMDDKDIRKIVSYLQSEKLEFEYPLSCKLFYLHDEFVSRKEEFFISTKERIAEHLRGLSSGQAEQKCQYCTLIYLALCGGSVQAQKSQDISFLKAIAVAKKIILPDLDFNFGCCLIRKGKHNTYEIVHEEVTKFIFCSFGYVHTQLLYDHCGIEVLLRYMRSDDQGKRREYRNMGLLIITNNTYEYLFPRLQLSTAYDKKHVIFNYKDFRKKYENYIRNSNLKTVVKK